MFRRLLRPSVAPRGVLRWFHASQLPRENSADYFFAHGGARDVIPANPQQLLVYYSSIYPAVGRLGRLLPPIVYGEDRKSTIKAVEKELRASKVPFAVNACVPRPFEGGAFIKFDLPQDASHEGAVAQVQSAVKPRRWAFVSLPTRVFPVLGTPWINDISDQYSSKLKIVLEGGLGTLSSEDLYDILRPYGRITSIAKVDDAVEVQFRRSLDAITARNCVYGLKLENGGKIKLSYIPLKRNAPIKDWISGHPRIFLPMLLTVMLGLAYIVFEPIREFFIQQQIQKTWSLTSYPLIRKFLHYLNWLENIGGGLAMWNRKQRPDSDVLLSPAGAVGALTQLQGYLAEAARTFIVVSGPKGSGKSHIVAEALQKHPLTLDIDCEALRAAKHDQDRLKVLSNMLGYWPVFLFMNNFSKFVDLGLQSVTGQSSGLSETADQQAKRMLSTTSAAIHKLALKGKPKDQRESAWLESSSAKKPVVIIHGYSPRDEMIAEWASDLALSGTAQVVFVTNDAGYDRSLRAALPNRLFQTITVDDISVSAARDYIVEFVRKSREHLAKQSKENQDSDGEKSPPPAIATEYPESTLSEQVLGPLGGRLTDLQAFARLIVSGEHPEDAIKNLIHQTALEVSQLFLSSDSNDFTPEQAWTLVRLLADPKTDWISVPGQLSFEPAFKKGDMAKKALSALESMGFVAVRTVGGRVTGVRTGRPLYKAAFQELVADPVIRSLQDSQLLTYFIKSEETKLVADENELQRLALIPSRSETKMRQDYLCQRLRASQEKITGWEKEILKLQGQLKATRDTVGRGTSSKLV